MSKVRQWYPAIFSIVAMLFLFIGDYKFAILNLAVANFVLWTRIQFPLSTKGER